jgi:hypothetical protein
MERWETLFERAGEYEVTVEAVRRVLAERRERDD